MDEVVIRAASPWNKGKPIDQKAPDRVPKRGVASAREIEIFATAYFPSFSTQSARHRLSSSACRSLSRPRSGHSCEAAPRVDAT
jgi:hypothetical protein